MNNDASAQVLAGLTTLIQQSLAQYSSEAHYPIGDSDRSDEILRDAKERAIKLRKLRHEFENTIHKVDL